MQAAKLTDRITIESPTFSKSATGDDEASWETFAEIWANVRSQTGRGREKFDGDRMDAEQWFQVEIRRLAGILPTMRILWSSYVLGDVVLEIRAVEPPLDRARNMFLACRRLS